MSSCWFLWLIRLCLRMQCVSWFNGSKVCGLYNLGVAKTSQERINKIGLCLEIHSIYIYISYIYIFFGWFIVLSHSHIDHIDHMDHIDIAWYCYCLIFLCVWFAFHSDLFVFLHSFFGLPKATSCQSSASGAWACALGGPRVQTVTTQAGCPGAIGCHRPRRRKFKSQTSGNMDKWKSRWEESEKRREERKSEKRKS